MTGCGVEDESGLLLRPPKARTWSRRGHTPVVTVRAAGSGRISLAGLACRRPGRRARLAFRMLVHHGRRHEKKGFRKKNFARLPDAVHQQLGRDTVLLWDTYTHHGDAALRELTSARQ
ncbi:transposase [Streptomyces sp. NPDC046925]|uniref:transposase n=1 Tax=Streptomyces sp. NPDC046925 TaxID=3155375 RepID=UPI0033E8B9F6